MLFVITLEVSLGVRTLFYSRRRAVAPQGLLSTLTDGEVPDASLCGTDVACDKRWARLRVEWMDGCTHALTLGRGCRSCVTFGGIA